MWLYSDFIQVNKKFYEVFSENTDRTDAGYWKTFIPHQTMVDLLDGLLKALEGVSRKSPWIYGPYGTGKTHAQFVLKHLLEDPWEVGEAYFLAHAQILNKDLLKRLQVARNRGQGLVVFLSSSASLNSNRKLMAEVQLAVKQALAARGLNNIVTPTLYEQIVGRLADEQDSFDWPRAFAKHKGIFPDVARPEQVLARLRAADMDERMDLIERVARVMDAEGFMLAAAPAAIKTWLLEVIDQHHIPWVVFFWDEFTDFFNQVPSLTGLLELLHLSAEAPFFLVLTTHHSPGIIQQRQGARNEDFKKLLDRVDQRPCSMEPLTAYRLLRNMLQVRPGQEQRWAQEQDLLWEQVKPAARNLLSENDRDADLRRLAPIHPYTARLLSDIASGYNASQRTMFKFIKRDEPGALLHFIGEHPKDDWRWYTADAVWDYFFASGVSELSPEARDVASYARSREAALQDESERRAFKAVMLLMALSRSQTKEVRHVQPTLANLKAMFAGTPLAARIETVMEDLANRDLVRRVGTWGEKQYTIPLGNVDRDAIRKYRDEIKFAEQASPAGAGRQTGAVWEVARTTFGVVDETLARRQSLAIVSAQDLKTRRERVIARGQLYQVAVVVALALNETERQEAIQLAAQIAQAQGVVCVVPEAIFGEARWQEWADNKAHARWYKENSDPQNAKYHESAAANEMGDWAKELRSQAMYAFDGSEQSNRVVGLPGYSAFIKEAVARRFPYRPERLTETGTLYNDSFGVPGATTGLTGGRGSGAYGVVVSTLERQGLWPHAAGFDPTIYDRQAETPLGAMTRKVREMFGQNSVSLGQVWETLQAPPYGLLPSVIGGVLMGILLRDSVDGYYYSDGANTLPLDRTKLANLINDVMHDKRTAASITLSRTTPEQDTFCEFVREVFDLPLDETRYPPNARDSARRWLTNTGYPVWALKYASSEPFPALQPLEEILREGQGKSELLSNEHLAEIGYKLRVSRERMAALVARRPFEQAMETFIRLHAPHVLTAASQLNLSLVDLMKKLRGLLNEEVWLWREDEVTRRLPELQNDLQLVYALDELLGKRETALDPALDHLRAKIAEGRLPLFVLRAGQDEAIAALLDELARLLANPRDYADKAKLAANLLGERDRVRAALETRIEALLRWGADNLSVSIETDQALEICKRLPPTPAADAETFKAKVQALLREFTKHRLIAELRAAWQEITGSDSPDDWNNAHGVPILWVLESQDYVSLFNLVNQPESFSEDRINAALQFIRAHQAELGQINAPDCDINALLDVTLQEYREYARSGDDFKSLFEYLSKRMGINITRWERSRAAQLGKQWVQDQYQQRFYKRVVEQIESSSTEVLKRALEDLAQDPLIGMKWLQRQHK